MCISVQILSGAPGLLSIPWEVIQSPGAMAGTAQCVTISRTGFPELCFHTCIPASDWYEAAPLFAVSNVSWCSSKHLTDPLAVLNSLAEAGSGDVSPIPSV